MPATEGKSCWPPTAAILGIQLAYPEVAPAYTLASHRCQGFFKLYLAHFHLVHAFLDSFISRRLRVASEGLLLESTNASQPTVGHRRFLMLVCQGSGPASF